MGSEFIPFLINGIMVITSFQRKSPDCFSYFLNYKSINLYPGDLRNKERRPNQGSSNGKQLGSRHLTFAGKMSNNATDDAVTSPVAVSQ